MKSKFFKSKSARGLILAFTIVFLLLPYSFLMGGSVYVIADINSSPTPINSYDIQGNQLVYQTQSAIPYAGWGGVGIAVDTASNTLFVTYEQSSLIQLIDAQFMTDLGTTNAPNAGNLAGMVYDDINSILYAIDRNTNHLFRYSWNAATTTLTLIGGSYVSLPGVNYGFGLALDYINNILYVGDNHTSGVKYFSTTDFSTLLGSIPLSLTSTDVTIDVSNQLLYATDGGPNGGTYLSKYNLNTNTETTFNILSVTLGVDVNQFTGIVYLTTSNGNSATQDRVIALDSNGNITWSTAANLGDPTGIVVAEGLGYNPLDLDKSDNLGGNCVQTGNNITYTLSFTNLNTTSVTGVTLADQLPPNVSFVSCTGGGIESGGVVTWNVGSVAPGAGSTFQLVVTVNEPPGGVILNNCTISSNETGQSTATILSNVCQGPVPQVPLSNWAIIISVALIGMVIWVRRGRLF